MRPAPPLPRRGRYFRNNKLNRRARRHQHAVSFKIEQPIFRELKLTNVIAFTKVLSYKLTRMALNSQYVLDLANPR